MKIAFAASATALAQDALKALTARYKNHDMATADCIVAIGGDGLVLKTLYAMPDRVKPVFALRRTDAVGFLCNAYEVDGLEDRLRQAQKVILHPLTVTCKDTEGKTHTAHAINEATVLRDSAQSAKLRVMVDGIERLPQFSGDGLLVATPAGSTAYNHSAGGPIMPLTANTLAITAICGYRPRRWGYAILPQTVTVDIETLESPKRPVRLEAGLKTVPNVASVRIQMDFDATYTLLFDPHEHLGERIIQEQFMP